MVNIAEKIKETISTSLEPAESAHHTVLSFLSTIPSEDTTILHSSKTELMSTYTDKHGLTLQEVQKHFSDPATVTITKLLKPIMFSFLPHLLHHHQQKDLNREVDAALKNFVEMGAQLEANNALEAKLDKEDAQERAMEQLQEKYAEQTSAKSLKQIKALLRRNLRRTKMLDTGYFI